VAADVVAGLDALVAMSEEVAVHPEPVWRERANFMISAALEKGRWEQLWARQLGPNRFEICCVPFFAYDLALGDEVETAPTKGKQYVVSRIAKPSGRYIFRAWFGETTDALIRDQVVTWLTSSGCLIEWSSDNLLAVDVPTVAGADEVAAYLQKQEDQGLLGYETGRR
jgi:hypothetical protein